MDNQEYTLRNTRIRNISEWERRSLEGLAQVRKEFYALIDENDALRREIERHRRARGGAEE